MPKAKKASKASSKALSGRRFKITSRQLSIFVAIVFIMGVAAYGTYRMGRSHASATYRNQVWAGGLAFAGCASQFGYPATIQQGSTGPCVAVAQNLLNKWQRSYTKLGFDRCYCGITITDLGDQLTVDGSYGPRTTARVREFQSWVAGVTGADPRRVSDGVVGPNTWLALHNCIFDEPNPGLQWTCYREGTFHYP